MKYLVLDSSRNKFHCPYRQSISRGKLDSKSGASLSGLIFWTPENQSLPVKGKTVTSVTAGPGVGSQAVCGASGEADMATPEGCAEALRGTLAHFLQIRAALVHFQKVPGKCRHI